MRAPKVSVVIPTYNMVEYLPAAIDSALGQSFADLELVVLDNASTDATPDRVARYRDPRLRALRNPRNLGLAGNVERGIAEARGACVAILGADDIWRPDFLARAVAVLDRNPAMTMVHGPAVWIDEAGQPFGGTGHVWPPRTPGARAMREAFGAGFCFSTMLMRTDAIRATGPFDPRWQEVIDLWLFLRMCLAGEVGYLDEVLVEYRVHAAAMSMPMYRQNLMFRRQMTAAREAFAWPEARAIGADRHRRAAERHAARIALEVLHMSRADGRGRLLRNFGEVAAAVPEILVRPATWARLGFGLLPQAAIRRLQQHRRARSLGRMAAGSAGPRG